jgi:hypothetical protein
MDKSVRRLDHRVDIGKKQLRQAIRNPIFHIPYFAGRPVYFFCQRFQKQVHYRVKVFLPADIKKTGGNPVHSFPDTAFIAVWIICFHLLLRFCY